MTAPLHIKYRPDDLDQVVGQKAVIKSLAKVLSSKHVPHAYLFTGPSGVGKTTLARILAKKMKCLPTSILEIDAATNSGIENMRAVLENIRFRGFGESATKFVIVDEAHGLSKATFQSLLLAIEEPPGHVYWALCTTESDKIPETIRTRCHSYKLSSVKPEEILEVLEAVRDLEKLSVTDEILGLVSRQADGSVRRALVQLSMVDDITDKTEVLKLLEKAGEEKGVIDLARLLVKDQGATWENVAAILAELQDQNPESIRLTIISYVNKVLLSRSNRPKLSFVSPTEATRLMSILDAFSRPCNQSEGMAPILLAVGQLLFTSN